MARGLLRVKGIPAFALLAVVAAALLLLPGCAAPVPNSADAICSGTLGMRKAHAGSLAADGGPRSLVTGQRLLSSMQAGCGEPG